MAGDWIKMRTNLRRHPKVVRMASALNADRLRVVGGLHAVWSLFDEHSDDGRLDGYGAFAIDDEIGWTGFSAQMAAVGWLDFDGDRAVALPDFDTHNGASAKRRAQETDRKRAERAAAKPDPQDVDDVSAFDADKKRTREEKRREEKKNPPKAPQGGQTVEIPDWIPGEPWGEFVAMRRAKGSKTPFTVGAAKLVIAELSKLRAQGQDPTAVLQQSVRNGWSDVYPLKEQPRAVGAASTLLAGAV